jgi:hypothetical protein
VTCHFFENGNRSLLGQDHGFSGNDEGLLKRELAFEHSMADHIGENEPGGVRGELPTLLGTLCLKTRAFLEEIVEAVHEAVVRRAVCTWPVYRAKNVRKDAVAPPARDSYLPGKARRQDVKGFRGDPNAIVRWVEIGENAKNAAAIGRTSRESIYVGQVVARACAGGATVLFHGAKAGKIAPPAPGVERQELRHELGHALGVASQDRKQAVSFGRARVCYPCETVFERTIGNVLMKRKAGLLLIEEEFAIVR